MTAACGVCGVCIRCRLAAKDSRYAQQFGLPGPSAARRAAPTPSGCAHFGEPTGKAVRCPSCRGTVELKLFACAVHGTCTPSKKLDGVACCKGCPDRAAPPVNLVTIPDPPPLSLTPRSTRVVVTVAAGAAGHDLHALSGDWQRHYAARVGADYLKLDWNGTPEHAIYAKFGLVRVLDLYERAVFLDADTEAHPLLCPDLFARVTPGEFGIYNDLPGLSRNRPAPPLMNEYQDMRAALGLKRLPSVPWYGNTGVMVFDRSHRAILAPPDRPIPREHCGEQHVWVARLHDSGTPIRFIADDCNRQWWENDGFSQPQPPGAILHFSGIRPHKTEAERLRQMRRHHDAMGLGAYRLRVVGVGLPRTGTASLAAMLSTLRSAHEPEKERMQAVVRGEVDATGFVIERQRRLKLGADISHLNIHALAAYRDGFPATRFVLTVREPTAWLASVKNFNRTHPDTTIPIGNDADTLAYRDWHDRSVREMIPAERLLEVRTEELDASIEQIAEFVGVGAKLLRVARENVGDYSVAAL